MSATAAPDQFEGFMCQGPENWQTFKKQKFTPKVFEDHDVDIVTECCGVCGSDVHTVTGGWGEWATKPLCVGHEIIGRVLRVGAKVDQSRLKPGMRVGVGAQVQSCMQCDQCKNDNENYCPNMVDTYNAPYNHYQTSDPMKVNGQQVFSQGGFSSHARVHEQFVFVIPDGISSEEAGPMMCAGLTTFAPLVRAGTGPGKHVGIVGIGGLGHFGILWAKGLGAKVTALSHSADKEKDARALGADEFVLTTRDGWAKPLAFQFDFLLNCADMTHKFDLTTYLGTLKVNGLLNHVGLPDEPLPAMDAKAFVPNGARMGASHLGNRREAEQMLRLAADKNLHPIIQTRKVTAESDVGEVLKKVQDNEVRYRYVLTGFHEAFGTK